MITFIILSFIAGVLTVAAPCILPLLPIIIGGTITRPDGKTEGYWYRPLVIALSLAISVVIFTLLLKATTTLLNVPQEAWSIVSGVIIILLGITLLFPSLWEKVATRFNIRANKALGASETKHTGVTRDILMGAALGPVFNSCSPTYALIVAVVLPESFATGLLYLAAYAIGLAGVLLLIAVAGQAVTKRLGWLSNPDGWFKRVIGLLFLLVGVAIILGLDKEFQAYVLNNGWYDPIMKFEQSLNIE